MVFGAVAVPITLLIGMKGSEYWLTAVESGAVIGAICAGVFWYVTSDGIIIGTIEDAVDVFKDAVCAII